MELKIDTIISQMTVIIESFPINEYQNGYVAWFKEMTSIVVQADSINEAIDELHISLKVSIEYSSKIALENLMKTLT